MFWFRNDEPREIRDARASLRQAQADRVAARAAHAEAQTRLERAESVAGAAVATIERSFGEARSCRKARQDLRTGSLLSGASASAEADARFAERERAALRAIADARLEAKSAKQALPDLRQKADDARIALRFAEDILGDCTKAVAIAVLREKTAKRGEELAAELAEIYKLRAAGAAVLRAAPAPLVQTEFTRYEIEAHMTALHDFRTRLAEDADARLMFDGISHEEPDGIGTARCPD